MKLKITVHGVAYEVEVEVLDAGEGFPAMTQNPLPSRPQSAQPVQSQRPAGPLPPKPRQGPSPAQGCDGGSIGSPIAGNVLEIKCKPGECVKKDQPVIVIEAMKMETAIVAPADGIIKSIEVAVGDAVRESQILVHFE